MKKFEDISYEVPAAIPEIRPEPKKPERHPSDLGIGDIGTFVDEQPQPGESVFEDIDEDPDPTTGISPSRKTHLNS